MRVTQLLAVPKRINKAIVPIRFRDWWDDWDLMPSPFSRSRLWDQNFGLGLHRDDLLSSFFKRSPFLSDSGYMRPWINEALQRLDSGSTVNIDKNKFEVIIRNYYWYLTKYQLY